MQRVIDVNRTCKVTKGGGIMSFTALVIVGRGLHSSTSQLNLSRF
jgi:ribosomal protein S5